MWGGCFSDGGASFLKGEGGAPGGASVLMGGFRKKSLDEGAGVPPPPTMGNPGHKYDDLFGQIVWYVMICVFWMVTKLVTIVI